MSATDETVPETAGQLGIDPRTDAFDRIDQAWIDGMQAHLHHVGLVTDPEQIAVERERVISRLNADTAKVSALIYVGDQIKALRDDLYIQHERGRA